mmetsp:Transcript_8678/g.12024  ORF Transcript_8678/g.12024 Transcript_8678/m.12024 type:complete len:105 (+) Transcript_8678:81-395(+)
MLRRLVAKQNELSIYTANSGKVSNVFPLFALLATRTRLGSSPRFRSGLGTLAGAIVFPASALATTLTVSATEGASTFSVLLAELSMHHCPPLPTVREENAHEHN